MNMREYAAEHGWEVGSKLRHANSDGPPSEITAISANEIRISTPGDFPGRLTGGHDGRLENWTLVTDGQERVPSGGVTGRREHWDDDLIEAVRRAMRDNPWSVFAVIAAVEDKLCTKAIASREEAIEQLREAKRRIERVQHLANSGHINNPDSSDWADGYNAALAELRAALGGSE